MRRMNEKNKVKSLFESLSKKGEKALICYIVGGYPDLETSKEIIKTLIDSGADIIEIGIPILNYVKSADHPEAVGYALPGYTVDILDENHEPLPDGSVGNLGIKGPGMFDAYLLPPSRLFGRTTGRGECGGGSLPTVFSLVQAGARS